MSGWTVPAAPFAAAVVVLLILPASSPHALAAPAGRFEGRFYSGQGDVEYLQLLDIARRMFDADAEFQNVAMLYTPAWNGFVEGPTWGAWWIQNSYGPTYCAMPFYTEPLITFLQNAHDLWFDQMGDGRKVFKWRRFRWTVPDGQLCDAAAPGLVIPKQGDGRVDIHDWGIEFTAAGLLMQAELLLISRDAKAIRRYLPRLERCANFIETRRDPKNDLFLAGPAGNLLAPSFAGYRKPDGTYGKAYLAGLSITYIAALDRLIELEKLADRPDKAKLFAHLRESARKGLGLLATDEGYFIKSLDPDGTKHGVYGAKKYGYFEAVCNHDAICFRVADDAQAKKIYAKIASIPGLRPHDFIITNYPSLDDMYVPASGWLWKFGTWVNGGHWSTCEGRMVMGYYRLGRYEDARRSMKQLMKFARAFRMDNPLVNFGSAVYQPRQAINLCYDSFGPPAAMIRGLFEYLYRADGLTLLPHIPPGITRLEQHFPVRFGTKRLYLATAGSGPVTAVSINARPWKSFDDKSVFLPYDRTPDEAVIQIILGDAKPKPFAPRKADPRRKLPPPGRADEKLLGPERFPNITPNRLPLRIGADSDGGSRFLGDIAGARVFARALEPREIARLAQGKPGKLSEDPALVAHWTFEDRKGNAFGNAAGAQKGLAAKIVGKVEVARGPHGKAIRLSGQGYLEVAHDARLDLTKGGTLDAWICPKKMSSAGGRILDKSKVGTDNGYLLDTHPGNSLRLICQGGHLSYDARLKPGQWVHAAASVAPDGARALYINGKRVAFAKAAGPLDLPALTARVTRMRELHGRLVEAGLAESYEAAHARLAVEYLAAFRRRLQLQADGKIKPLPQPSQHAADKSYIATAVKLCDGLAKVIDSYQKSPDARSKRVYRLWTAK